MKKISFLLVIIFLEGYAVLSAELLGIRQTIPYVGSGTDTVSIIIAAVLLPLAFGYFAGGNFKRHPSRFGYMTIRRKLLHNIFIACFFFVFALSHILIAAFFETLSSFGVTNRLAQITLYSALFFVYPVFLLAQTIPLVSHFFKKDRLAKITGKMLAFSTAGSFMGAVFSTLALMSFIGVHYTAVVTIGSLTLLYILLEKSKNKLPTVIMIGLFIFAFFINSNHVMRAMGIVENNRYSTIQIIEKNNGMTRRLSVNGNNSSMFSDVPVQFGNDPKPRQTFVYTDFINTHFIDPIIDDEKIYKILVVGAGGFTIGFWDEKNDYMYIDIDGSLKKISEEYLLKQPLSANKKFEAKPARAFLYEAAQRGDQFDLIILDAYLGGKTIPEHMVTKEFYESVRKVLSKDGIVVGNFITSASFSSLFSLKLDNTIRAVFPHVNRHILGEFNGWNRDDILQSNVIYIYHNRQRSPDGIYTDDLNRIHFDKEKRVK